MTLPQPLQFEVFEFRGRMGGGQTKPLRCVARTADGRSVSVVLKLRDPGGTGAHHRGTSLALELILATVARAIGLRVPDYGIARVGPIFANGVTDPEAHQLLVQNLGDNFASVLISPGIRSWDPQCASTSGTLRSALDGVLTFDAAVINGDRSAGNPNLLWNGGDDVHMIDHGLACPVHQWPDPAIVASPQLPDANITAHAGYAFLKGQGCQFSYALGNWAANMTDARWRELRGLVPASWEARAGDLDRIFSFLMARHGKFLEVGTNLRRVLQ